MLKLKTWSNTGSDTLTRDPTRPGQTLGDHKNQKGHRTDAATLHIPTYLSGLI